MFTCIVYSEIMWTHGSWMILLGVLQSLNFGWLFTGNIALSLISAAAPIIGYLILAPSQSAQQKATQAMPGANTGIMM